MSPSLEGMMFNRNTNLSARRPLLAEPQKSVVVPPRAPPRDPGLQRPLPAPRNLTNNLQSNHDHRPDYWKPSNVEIERRMQEMRAREKVAYFQDKVTPPDMSLDRREAELVFRFDPHASAEYLSNQYHAPTVQYSKPAAPANGFSRVPERDGPFVFGVHTPSQFPIPRRDADDYDYSEVVDDQPRGRTVIPDDHSGDLNCCDRVNDWTSRDKKARRTLNRMFTIKDKRKVKGSKKKIKCVLVGDGAVGKSSLIAAYAQDTFREEYQPTAHDTFNVVVDVDDRPICVEICDTAGQDAMSELRELAYPGTDVLMLCFSVVRPETFKSVAERWTRAVANVNAPLVLVGTQSDLALDGRVLRTLKSKGEHPVTETEAKALATKINAVYVETSAKTRKQLKDAFDAAILAGLPIIQHKKPFWKKLLCIN